MVRGSGVRATINVFKVPVLPEVWEYTAMGLIPVGTRRNLGYIQPSLQVEQGVSEDHLLVLADAQTSGGLLMAVTGGKAPSLLTRLTEAGVTAAQVGQILPLQPPKEGVGANPPLINLSI